MISQMFLSRKLTASGETQMDARLAIHRDQVWSRLLGLFVGIAAYSSATAAEAELAKPAAIQTQDVPPIPAEFRRPFAAVPKHSCSQVRRLVAGRQRNSHPDALR
jgi:hypothetical protein